MLHSHQEPLHQLGKFHSLFMYVSTDLSVNNLSDIAKNLSEVILLLCKLYSHEDRFLKLM